MSGRRVQTSRGYQKEEQTFTGTGSGDVIDCTQSPKCSFALSVKETGTVTSWTVVLRGSLDGENWETILTHTKLNPGNGVTKFTGTSLYPCLFFKIECTALVLGGGTSIGAIALGMA